jgi:ribosomal silencing factor RsfS
LPSPHDLFARRSDRRSRVADLLMLVLISDKSGEVMNTRDALIHIMKKSGADAYDLVGFLEDPHSTTTVLSERQIEEINDEITRRVKAAREDERRKMNFDFARTDDWRRVAFYVDRERQRLPARNRDPRTLEFISSMATLARSPYERTISEKRGKWLYGLFAKLGGRLT